MQELKVIGVENGALLAASDEGARFRIPIDDVVQSKLRQSHPESPNAPRLAPREVQAHIRAGLSAEEVATLTGASLEAIRRFEGPVLAEREHIVNSALAVPVHIEGEVDPDTPPTFGSVIRDRLDKLGADRGRWASWKEEDRGWMVKLEFRADDIDHDARWGFEPRKRALQPLNSEAVTLSQPGEPKEGLIPKLRAVGAQDPDASRFDSGAFAFDDDLEPADAPPQPEPLSYSRTVKTSSPAAANAAIKRAAEPEQAMSDTADLLEALRKRRGERESAAVAEVSDDTEQSLDIPLSTFDEEFDEAPAPAPARAPRKSPQKRQPAAKRPPQKQEAQKPAAPAQPAGDSLWGRVAASGESDSATPARATANSKKGRASMPSWDEIVFGARSDDDPA
ncbi:DNA-binding protein [Agromyces rhizosphaerae]|uniref:DNA-binding protein n=1 Tax=Agromyces rhizosphaerae TaxID=88374 RepID=A0A9W6D342_9MICO|nr:septation protein SepH [Agromyces rhizosphaerae]GLI28748.1 DNA-binding protein [Agromyces rhizosphaerae]